MDEVIFLKYISKVIVTLFIVECFLSTSLPTAYGWEQNDEITKANIYIDSEFELPGYYTDYAQITLTNGNINSYGLNKQLLIDGGASFS